MKQTSSTSKTYTYTTKSFAGKVVDKGDGNKGFVFNSKLYYQNELNKFKDEEEVSMVLTSKKPKRTELQNNYYWGVYLPLISEETGNDVDSLHALFRGKFLTKEIKEVMGEKVRIVGSTATLSTGKFMEYIMDIESLTGVASPPTENFFDTKPDETQE